MQKLVIDKEYSIEYEDIIITKIKIPFEDLSKFEALSSKAKISKLKYLKYVKGKELEMISIVAQSKYLRLLKDQVGYHIRFEEYLPEDILEAELKIVELLQSRYQILLDEEVNTGMSGDQNRIEISKGSLME